MTSAESHRTYAVLLIVGAIVGLVANALHPHAVAIDEAALLSTIAGSDAWVGIHAGIIVAVLLVTGGLIDLARLLLGGSGGALARLGLTAGVMGCAVISVSTAVDGFALKSLAAAYVHAPADEAAVALRVAAAVQEVDFAIWSVGMLIFFGLAFLCLGAGMVLDRRFRVLGAVAVVAGTGSACAAMLQILNTGETPLAEVVFLGSSLLITIWAFVAGVVLWRAPVSLGRGVSA